MSMRCPKCKGITIVKDSRPTHIGRFEAVRRRRRCMREECGFRFTTFEAHEDIQGDFKKLAAAQSAVAAIENVVARARKIIGPEPEIIHQGIKIVFDSNM